MASPFSHAVAALSIGTCFYRPRITNRVWVAGLLCSILPDLDVIGFRFGIRYGDFWGHRRFRHSLVFAAILAGAVAAAVFRRGSSGIERFPPLRIFVSCDRQRWSARRNDERRAGGRVLLAVR